MAFTVSHLLVAFALVFVSLTISGANAYGYAPTVGSGSPYGAKPGLVEKPKVPYVSVPKPTYVEKPKPYVYQPKPTVVKPKPYVYVPKPTVVKPKPYVYAPKAPSVEKPKPYVYTPKPSVVKPKPYVYVPKVPTVVKPKPYVYVPKVPTVVKPKPYVYVPKPASVEKPKPYVYKPETTNVEKPKAESTESYGYDNRKLGEYVSPYGQQPKHNLVKPKPFLYIVPKPKHAYVPYNTVGVQGIITCKSGPKFAPLKGAVAKVTCLAVDEYGSESAPFSVLSAPTDYSGYFLAKVPLKVQGKFKITECKVFLKDSPSETCNIPTDYNKGTTGAPLGSCKLLSHLKLNLCSVGTFAYTSKPKPVHGGY